MRSCRDTAPDANSSGSEGSRNAERSDTFDLDASRDRSGGVGEGSTYPWTALDSEGRPLDGGKSYKLHLPPHVPVRTFWSVIVYSARTRSMVQTDQRFPSVSSQNEDLQANADGSVDVHFGPKPPADKESNWIQTVPGQAWFTILRLYGPLEPWFKGAWRPGEVELQP